jgi:hypothetical protein
MFRSRLFLSTDSYEHAFSIPSLHRRCACLHIRFTPRLYVWFIRSPKAITLTLEVQGSQAHALQETKNMVSGSLTTHSDSAGYTMADGIMGIVKGTLFGTEGRGHTVCCTRRRLMAGRAHLVRSSVSSSPAQTHLHGVLSSSILNTQYQNALSAPRFLYQNTPRGSQCFLRARGLALQLNSPLQLSSPLQFNSLLQQNSMLNESLLQHNSLSNISLETLEAGLRCTC